LLHRILQRICIGFCSALKIGISYLQVMLAGNADTVTKPSADNMQREASRQLRLSCSSKTVKQARPGLETGPVDNSQELGSQVDVGISVSINDEDRARFGQLEGLR
jgi:hypothetical protein